MTDDDRDLSRVFDDLTAPASVGRYQAPRPQPLTRREPIGRRWPQAMAGVVAVLVAFAGAGTFLALRTARQGDVATSGSGSPAGRTGAAMAYDSTAGVTVMFGGTGDGGRALADTWLWDGSRWNSAPGASPGPLVGVHLADDPTDGGVLLVGTSEPGLVAGTGVACVAGGASGSGSANAATAVAGPPALATGNPGVATGAPPGTPIASLPSIPAPSVSPAQRPSCPPYTPPSVQTWLYSAAGWHRLDGGRGATVPFGDAQLAYDPASGDVLAVSSEFFPCGPLPAGSREPLIACEGAASFSAGSGESGAPQLCTISACGGAIACPLGPATVPVPVGGCGGGGVRTWAWHGGRWTASAATAAISSSAVTPYTDADTGRAALVADAGTGCWGPSSSCVVSNHLVRYSWNGATWAERNDPASNALQMLSPLAAVGLPGQLVVVTANGETWTMSGGAWTRRSTLFASRAGESTALGPKDTLVLFGGDAVARTGLAVAGGGVPGSDTWTWSAGAWHRAGGVAPAPPTPCPGSGSNGCIEILPAQVPPAAVPRPATTPTTSPVP